MNNNRRFGRSSEVLFNEKLFKIVKQLETLSLERTGNLPPKAEEEKALWIDPDESNDLKYYFNGQWYPFYKEKFQMITEILEEYTPVDPVPGQLWIKDGVLMYFDGMEWLVIKAGDIDNENFSSASYHNFLIIDPLKHRGDIVTDTSSKKPIKKTQFLVPDVKNDKVFIDGYNNEDFEQLTNVAIQYETDRLRNRHVSAVHVNPSNLLNIKKSLILIDKDENFDGIIRVNKTNKEFYGFTHGGGRLLLRNIDYTHARGNFIKLTKKARRKFDFIMVVEYIFGKSKHKGELVKSKIDFSKNSSASINKDIRYTDKQVFIFEDGYIKTIDRDNYDIKDGEIIFKGNIKGKKIQAIDVSLDNLLFKGKVNDGYVTVSENPLFDDMVENPFVFIESGKKFDFLELDKSEMIDGRIKLPEEYQIDGNKYMVLSFSSKDDKQNLQYNTSTIIEESKESLSSKRGMIKLSDKQINPRSKVLLFINGKVVSSKEYNYNPIKKEIDGIDTNYIGSKAIVFIDNNNNVLIDDKIEEIIIAKNETDKTLVYIEERLICDPETVLSLNLPKEGYEGEIKFLIDSQGRKRWYVRKNRKWLELNNYQTGDIKLLTTVEPMPFDPVMQITKEIDNENKDYILNKAHNRIIEFIGKEKFMSFINNQIDKNKITVSTKVKKDHNITPSKNILVLSKQGFDEIVFYFDLKKVDIIIPRYYQSKLVDIIYDQFSSDEVKKSSLLMIDLEIKELLNKKNKFNDNLRDEINDYIGQESLIYIDVKNKKAQVKTVADILGIKDTIGTIKHLEYTINGYNEDRNNISILQTYGGEEANIYSYKFASHIDQPRKVRENYELNLFDNEDNNGKGFLISYNNFYEPNRNELAVYLDGVRQYHVEETSGKTFKIEGNVEGSDFAYIDEPIVKASIVAEPCENKSSLSSKRRVVKINETIPGMYNTYKVDIDLYPGYNRMYVDGIRQPSSSFKILDRRHFMLFNITEEMMNNEMEILIEHKDDIDIKEKHIILSNYDGLEFTGNRVMGRIDIDKFDIDESILETREELRIYIDGVFIGTEYTIDRENKAIKFTAENIPIIEENLVLTKTIERYNLKLKELYEKELSKKDKKELEEEIEYLKNKINKLEKERLETNLIFEWR